jgi:putative membrane protein (TIGR04086 family)
MVRQLGQNVKTAVNEHVTLFSVIKGIVVSYFITLPAFLIFSYVLTYTDYPENYIPTSVIIVTIMSILVAGSTATRNVKNRGWLNGAAVGLVYMLVLYLFSSLTYKNFSVDKHVIIMMFIGMLTGSIGGIIGINFRRKSRAH